MSYAADVFLGSGASVSAGASTSVFGLFVAVALLGVLHRGNRSVFAQYSKGMLGVIAVNVAYTLLVPGISVSGHLGGALGGAAAMLMLPRAACACPPPCASSWPSRGRAPWGGCSSRGFDRVRGVFSSCASQAANSLRISAASSPRASATVASSSAPAAAALAYDGAGCSVSPAAASASGTRPNATSNSRYFA